MADGYQYQYKFKPNSDITLVPIKWTEVEPLSTLKFDKHIEHVHVNNFTTSGNYEWVPLGNNWFAGPVQDYENYQPMPQVHGRLPETDKLPALKHKVIHPGMQKKAEECAGKCNFVGYCIFCTTKDIKHPLEDVIVSLNDIYKWTREQIADWLDSISDPTGENGPDIRFKPV